MQCGVIFKIDSEKVYARYNLCASDGSASINVNDMKSHPIFKQKSIRLGDHISPLLFNTIEDMQAILINRAKAECQVWGTVPHAAMLPSSRRFIYNRICL